MIQIDRLGVTGCILYYPIYKNEKLNMHVLCKYYSVLNAIQCKCTEYGGQYPNYRTQERSEWDVPRCAPYSIRSSVAMFQSGKSYDWLLTGAEPRNAGGN